MPGLETGGERTHGGRAHEHASRQREHHEPAHNQGQQWRGGHPPGVGDDREQPHHDQRAEDVAEAVEHVQRQDEGPLEPAGGRGDGVRIALDVVGLPERGQVARHGLEGGVGVDLGDLRVRVAPAQRRDQTREGHRAAAHREEVAVRGERQGPELVRPQLREPREVALEGRGAVVAGGGQRPRQGLAVHLAGGLHGQLVHEAQRGDHPSREPLHEPAARLREVHGPLVLGHQVARDHAAAARCGVHGARAQLHAGHLGHLGVDLAELDASAGDLDLVVGAAREDDALGIRAHHVAGAVGALPPERLQRGVLLGVLDGVQVAAQTHAADDQLTGLAPGHGLALGVHDGELPPGHGQPDADGRLAGQQGAGGDHGGLGGAVGVPHLTPGTHEVLRELQGARLAPEDEQPHAVQGLAGPQGGQRGHGGDGGDLLVHDPLAEVRAGAHDAPGRGHQGGAVAPGQPHLLARGVERHGQPRHHAVAGPERAALEVHLGLRVHKGRSGAVADGHALRLARGARGEDDPGVVPRARGLGPLARGDGRAARQFETLPEDGGHTGLLPHRVGPLVGVVPVHRHVGRAREQRGQDGHVEVCPAGGNADADPVPSTHAHVPQALDVDLDPVLELSVGDGLVLVLEGDRVRELRDRVEDDVHQGARSRWFLHRIDRSVGGCAPWGAGLVGLAAEIVAVHCCCAPPR